MSRSEHPPANALTPPGAPSAPAIAGAHRVVPRAHRRTSATIGQQPPARYEPYLDGLFTYCLSVLCDHDSAAAALGDALAVAERHHGRLRDRSRRRPWLYALARWACLRRLTHPPLAPGAADRLAAAPQDRFSPPRGGGAGSPAPRTSQAVAAERRHQLATLAWPEAAGTTPEQREVLELALRHRLSEREIGGVLGLDAEAVRRLLSRAACEVERTRTALAVVGVGGCPAVARLTGDTHLLISTGLRRELVRHVDECPACRLTAEQVIAGGPWPGTTTPATLAIVEAPRAAVHAAMLQALGETRPGARDHRGTAQRPVPHFDRRGFPLDEQQRAARRAALRHRAVTTTVVAAVVAAPALALWAAYRHAPHHDPGADGNAVTTTDARGPYEHTGNGTVRLRHPGRAPTPGPPGSALVDDASADPSASADAPPPSPSPRAGTPTAGPGWITVAAQPSGDNTAITLAAYGGSPVRWTAQTAAGWLRLSAGSGVLRPGESVTITVVVDHSAEPSGPWRARVVVEPSGSVVTIEGSGRPAPSGSPSPNPSPSSARPAPSPS